MFFNDLLQSKSIDPDSVLVLRHRPTERELNRVLPTLAAERPELFNAYQQTQGERVEKAMQRAKYVAAFIARGAGRAIFAGLYERRGESPTTYDAWSVRPEVLELARHGMKVARDETTRDAFLWFDLAVTDFYADWKGKLVIQWPPPELSWWRWAGNNAFAIHAILETADLVAPVPPWDEMTLLWADLGTLPTAWRAALSEWRGVYLIFDQSDGKGYVGSAYGSDNLFGRWQVYAKTGHGGNVLLRPRNPSDFVFSILQLVSQDADPEDVVRLETTWKKRLHTYSPSGLNEN
jgi:hypothetical protein